MPFEAGVYTATPCHCPPAESAGGVDLYIAMVIVLSGSPVEFLGALTRSRRDLATRKTEPDAVDDG